MPEQETPFVELEVTGPSRLDQIRDWLGALGPYVLSITWLVTR